MATVRAIYENGILRPETPLELSEGQSVEVRVVEDQPPQTMEEWERRKRAAKSFEEWAVLARAFPDSGPDFDVMKAINETRRLTGFRAPSPEPEAESSK